MTLSRVGSVSTWFWLDLDLCGGAVKYYIIQPEVLAIFVRVTVSSRQAGVGVFNIQYSCGKERTLWDDTSKTDGRFFFRWGPSKLQHAELDTKTSSSLGMCLSESSFWITCTTTHTRKDRPRQAKQVDDWKLSPTSNRYNVDQTNGSI